MKLNHTDQGSGPAVILMHGMFGSLSNLGSLARELVPNYRVISVDLRNHGNSPHEDAMDLALMAADIVELMDDLDLAKAHLIGHSLGGKLGMEVALTCPDRLSSLVVADIAPVNYPQSNSHVVDGLRALDSARIDSRKAADQLLSDYIADTATRAFILKNLQRTDDGSFRLKLNVKSIVANYSSSLVAAPQVGSFSGPVLFIKGELSAYIQEKHYPLIKKLFPASELQVMDGVGHWLHAEKPELFNNSVMAFLNANG